MTLEKLGTLRVITETYRCLIVIMRFAELFQKPMLFSETIIFISVVLFSGGINP